MVAGAMAEPVEVHLWHAYRGEERTALESAIEAWDTAEPDVSVQVLALLPEGFSTKFEAAAPRGNGPDLASHGGRRRGGSAAPAGGHLRRS